MKPGTYLQKTYGYTDFQIGQIRYVIMSLLSEFSKLFIMGIFFYSTHMFGEYITAAFILCMIRTGAGGLHFKHYVTCFLFSFGIFFAWNYYGCTLLVFEVVRFSCSYYMHNNPFFMCTHSFLIQAYPQWSYDTQIKTSVFYNNNLICYSIICYP